MFAVGGLVVHVARVFWTARATTWRPSRVLGALDVRARLAALAVLVVGIDAGRAPILQASVSLAHAEQPLAAEQHDPALQEHLPVLFPEPTDGALGVDDDLAIDLQAVEPRVGQVLGWPCANSGQQPEPVEANFLLHGRCQGSCVHVQALDNGRQGRTTALNHRRCGRVEARAGREAAAGAQHGTGGQAAGGPGASGPGAARGEAAQRGEGAPDLRRNLSQRTRRTWQPMCPAPWAPPPWLLLLLLLLQKHCGHAADVTPLLQCLPRPQMPLQDEARGLPLALLLQGHEGCHAHSFGHGTAGRQRGLHVRRVALRRPRY
mmetsp:Transcript_50887/g.141155  ORF Transcript_50887/g.141155 Transcript_50887/m.141155 type:complete len:319 (+) Transcript_50887:120-1076(+)